MYLPASFAETDRDKLFAAIARHSFGVLFSNHEGRPMATHLPLLVERGGPLDRDGAGTLIGHVARANPQWRSAQGQTVLAVFSGPHAYVSPSWYEADGTVPTWNYVAVHVEGAFEAVDDLAETVQVVRRLTEFYEAAPAAPSQTSWSFDPQAEFIQRMAAQIVAFRIPIARIEGKWKLSQNQPRERQEKVVRALSQRSDENSRDVAALMRERLS